jgi:malate dehydrogenase
VLVPYIFQQRKLHKNACSRISSSISIIAYKESGFERNRVFGMGNILDAVRFRSHIALELNVSREDVRALVIGEHGDSMVPLVENASVSGISITCLLRKKLRK